MLNCFLNGAVPQGRDLWIENVFFFQKMLILAFEVIVQPGAASHAQIIHCTIFPFFSTLPEEN